MMLSMQSGATAWLPESWGLLLGRLHVVVVHFPIALLWMALLAEFVRIARRREERSPTAFACLTIGMLSALVAAAFGWLHAEAEPLDRSVEDTLDLHRWIGVATAAAATLTWMLAIARQGLVYRLALSATAALVTVAANFGGELVYGEDYLRAPLQELWDQRNGATAERTGPPAEEPTETSDALDPEPQDAGATAPSDSGLSARPVSFATEVEPIFAERCYRCHGPKKQRGELRLDDLAAHFARAPAEWVIRPGDAAASELYRRITLPADDEDAMPAAGDPLTADEIALVRAWIDQGARYE